MRGESLYSAQNLINYQHTTFTTFINSPEKTSGKRAFKTNEERETAKKHWRENYLIRQVGINPANLKEEERIKVIRRARKIIYNQKKEASSAYQQQYREEHREKLNGNDREYYSEHRERIREQQKQHYQTKKAVRGLVQVIYNLSHKKALEEEKITQLGKLEQTLTEVETTSPSEKTTSRKLETKVRVIGKPKYSSEKGIYFRSYKELSKEEKENILKRHRGDVSTASLTARKLNEERSQENNSQNSRQLIDGKYISHSTNGKTPKPPTTLIKSSVYARIHDTGREESPRKPKTNKLEATTKEADLLALEDLSMVPDEEIMGISSLHHENKNLGINDIESDRVLRIQPSSRNRTYGKQPHIPRERDSEAKRNEYGLMLGSYILKCIEKNMLPKKMPTEIRQIDFIGLDREATKILITEARKEYQRGYYQEHKEKAKEYSRQYNLTHRKKARGGRGKASFNCPREEVKISYNTSEFMHLPVEKLVRLIEGIINGNKFLSLTIDLSQPIPITEEQSRNAPFIR